MLDCCCTKMRKRFSDASSERFPLRSNRDILDKTIVWVVADQLPLSHFDARSQNPTTNLGHTDPVTSQPSYACDLTNLPKKWSTGIKARRKCRRHINMLLWARRLILCIILLHLSFWVQDTWLRIYTLHSFMLKSKYSIQIVFRILSLFGALQISVVQRNHLSGQKVKMSATCYLPKFSPSRVRPCVCLLNYLVQIKNKRTVDPSGHRSKQRAVSL